MSQPEVIHVKDVDNLFLELTCHRKLLTSQAVAFCRERMTVGIPASVTAVAEKFFNEEAVASLYRLIQEEYAFCSQCQGFVHQQGGTACQSCGTTLPEPKPLNIVVAQGAIEQDAWEQKFLDAVTGQNWFDAKAWLFFSREQRRIAAIGYDVPLSTIVCANLDPEKIAAIYQAIATEHKTTVAVVAQKITAAEVGLPQIRRLSKPTVRRAKKKTAPEAQIMEDLQAVLQKASAKKVQTKAQAKRAKTKAVPRREVDQQPEKIEMEEEIMSLSDALGADSQGKSFSMADSVDDNTQMFTKILQDLAKSLQQVAAAAKHKDDDTGDDHETRQLKRGKKILSEKEAMALFEKGGSIENAFIGSLQLTSCTVPKKVTINNSVFENVEFSQVKFEDNIDFEGCTFVGKAVFGGSSFAGDALLRNTTFQDGADFAKVTFSGNAHFNSASFQRYVSFNHAEFQQKAVFTRAYFAKGTKFAEVRFAGGASFNDMGCDHRFYMEKCKFDEETTFSNARFGDISDFSRTNFTKVVKFKGTQFAKWASFHGVHFQGECNFSGTTAQGDLSFEHANFTETIDLRTLCAERNVNLLDSKIGTNATFKLLDAYFGRLFITCDQLKGHLDSHLQKDFVTAQKEYGLLKNNFREINEYEQEDWAYLMEKRMERMSLPMKGLSAIKRFFNWLALDVACGYGTKPLNILATAISIIIMFALFYSFIGASQFQLVGKFSFWDGLLVSFRTFANAAIGGPEPMGNSWINYVMMPQSFLGLFVIAVLVVTFSRKVIR